MKFLGVDFEVKNIPELDKGFIPLGSFFDGYLKGAKKPVTLAIKRPDGTTSIYDTFIHDTADMREADRFYISRLVKILLWIRGGASVIVCGDEQIAGHIKAEYCAGGCRSFDAEFMGRVFDTYFTVNYSPIDEKPGANEKTFSVGNNFDGCRIGFDAGGSDRKVSAVVDGEAIYSEEVVWHPKLNEDPEYHFNGIVESFKTAASKMPKVDAIGVSSAGIYLDNHVVVASLFIRVPLPVFNEKVKDIFIRATKEIGDVPLYVLNDGDTTALSGAENLDQGSVLGIAMGTSQAGGYVTGEGTITNWLNELAFVPLDCNPDAMRDEWSGDIGCGVKYFSQDGVNKLAEAAGIKLDAGLSPAEKLKITQELMEAGDGKAEEVFRGIGIYLANAINLYDRFYDLKNILLLGRVMSGEGGNVISKTAERVLKEEYPELAKRVVLVLPDKSSRRVGQSITAAGLPKIE